MALPLRQVADFVDMDLANLKKKIKEPEVQARLAAKRTEYPTFSRLRSGMHSGYMG